MAIAFGTATGSASESASGSQSVSASGSPFESASGLTIVFGLQFVFVFETLTEFAIGWAIGFGTVTAFGSD
jgi:hypothetical protein